MVDEAAVAVAEAVDVRFGCHRMGIFPLDGLLYGRDLAGKNVFAARSGVSRRSMGPAGCARGFSRACAPRAEYVRAPPPLVAGGDRGNGVVVDCRVIGDLRRALDAVSVFSV